jgi:hypothetical protein
MLNTNKDFTINLTSDSMVPIIYIIIQKKINSTKNKSIPQKKNIKQNNEKYSLEKMF